MMDKQHQDITDILNGKHLPEVAVYLPAQPEFGIAEAAMIFFPEEVRAREWIDDRPPAEGVTLMWDVLTSDSLPSVLSNLKGITMACLVMQAKNPGELKAHLQRYSLDLVQDNGTPCV